MNTLNIAQLYLTLKTFCGTEQENWQHFESLFGSKVDVANISHTVPEVSHNVFNQCLAALEKHFCNPQLTKLHLIKLENMKFHPKKFQIRTNFWFKCKHWHCKPTQILIRNRSNERFFRTNRAKIDQLRIGNAANDRRQRFVDLERERQTKKIFQKSHAQLD